MTKDIVDGLKRKRFFEEGAHTVQLKVNERKLDSNKNVNVVSIYTNDDRTHHD